VVPGSAAGLPAPVVGLVPPVQPPPDEHDDEVKPGERARPGGNPAAAFARQTPSSDVGLPRNRTGFDFPPTVLAGWDNGFFIRSPDELFRLRFTGQIQTDYRSYENTSDTTDVDTFLLRRARLGIEADMFDAYEFRFLPDFGLGRTVIQDCYVNVHYVDPIQFEAGKFKQPFSYEQLIQDRYLPTVERSLIDQLTPGRDLGAMFHGQNLFGGRLDWAIAIGNGEVNGNSGAQVGNTPVLDRDSNRNKDFSGRIATRPFNTDCFPLWLRGLQVGISGTTGVNLESANPLTLTTPSGVPWYTFAATVRANGLRNRWSPELEYFYGPFGFSAQFYEEDEKFNPTTTGVASAYDINVAFEGGYVLGTLLLTGEQRFGYSQAIDPISPFNPFHPLAAPGGWELVCRASRLVLGSGAFQPYPVPRAAPVVLVADPTTSTKGVTELTVGFNWYLNRWVRVQFNYEHDWFDTPIHIGNPGPTGLVDHQDALLSRFQIIF
jgi:phosphate-selective porin OprO/OprP